MNVSIYLNKEEKMIAEKYVTRNGVSLSTAMKKAFFEQIEDEYDIATTDHLFDRYEKGLEKVYSHEEIIDMFK